MELKLNITLGQTITVILLMFIAFAGGLFIEYSINQSNKTTVTNEYTGFTDTDLNTLGNLAYQQGHCERIGLESTVLPQITDANEIYGIPICIEQTTKQK